MKFLDFLTPTKKITYQTSLSPKKVVQRLESKISPEPKRKSMFDIIPLSYHGKIEEGSFEIGRRSRGNKDHPPTAYGIVEENSNNPLETVVEVTIIPNHNFKTGMVLFILLISMACLPTLISIFYDYYDSIGFFIFLPIFFSLGFLMNYLIFRNYNKRLAKDIQRFIDGKIIK
ncbi:MAG: hypothetical protein COZ18_10785 [Flexibacter sp. CG_4_10_14_3_um_filter_32_15]|nr:MAG: hypothetical protein COZ18_10785 [Flexibacter sp. CG_4_10_14_3_um_filter_32_15]